MLYLATAGRESGVLYNRAGSAKLPGACRRPHSVRQRTRSRAHSRHATQTAALQ